MTLLYKNKDNSHSSGNGYGDSCKVGGSSGNGFGNGSGITTIN